MINMKNNKKIRNNIFKAICKCKENTDFHKPQINLFQSVFECVNKQYWSQSFFFGLVSFWSKFEKKKHKCQSLRILHLHKFQALTFSTVNMQNKPILNTKTNGKSEKRYAKNVIVFTWMKFNFKILKRKIWKVRKKICQKATKKQIWRRR